MKCQFCMEEIADNSEKCILCNSELVKPCPFCREKIQANALKCKHCGSMVDAGHQQQPPIQAQQPIQENQQATQYSQSPQPEKIKSQTTAAILCALIGGFGAHRFYLGPIWTGVVYLLLCWTGISGLIALVETYIIAFSSQETWAKKHNNGVITPPVHIAVKILVAILPIIAIVGILAAIAIPQFSAYRTKAYNSSALSDLKNAKTSLEAYFADHQRYPETLEASQFKPSDNVNVKCSILPDAYVCGSANKKGTVLYVTDDSATEITKLDYSAGDAIQLPYDPRPKGSAKADEFNSQNNANLQNSNTMVGVVQWCNSKPGNYCLNTGNGTEILIAEGSSLEGSEAESILQSSIANGKSVKITGVIGNANGMSAFIDLKSIE